MHLEHMSANHCLHDDHTEFLTGLITFQHKVPELNAGKTPDLVDVCIHVMPGFILTGVSCRPDSAT